MNKDIFMDLLQAKEYKAVRSILNVMNAVDIASLLSEMEDKELFLAFRLIPKEKAADVFAEMDSTMQAYLVEMFTEKELREILDDLYMDDTVDMLEEFPANLVTRILENVSKEKRDKINVILNYPEDSAGSIMTTEYVDLRRNTTVAAAMNHIKRIGIHKETIYTCYILENRKLVGIVSAKDLMTMDDNMTMDELMETEIISVHTHTDKEEVARLFSKYALLALPVLDDDERMVGIVTVDDAMDVMVDEATEDITKMAAMNPSEKPYFDTSVWQHAKNRIPWLLFLMLSATITGSIITRYQDAFSALPLLVSFIPMLMDTGGNCGSQSSTLIIRGIALDEVHFSDIFRVMFKEFRISIIVGAFLALANIIRIYLVYDHNLLMSMSVGLSLLATIVIAKLIGCILPLLAKQVHLDPAIMASPLITTLVDTCSIIIYFNIATRLLL
ncbi:magnesium transporter [Bariatricus massiliensis]|uniref:Magnesium transporter MgtE n=1 Tax=Bariatricus massiliensis TaxID=1745713 RepID=A0ABS8DN69_9FIRM|nr:magnesium transporter [Bariatricus massiliensis]MCB7303180.1 magnesium transporter [Bariatricus massiliensis]MCB7376631.1 magnesium transporter [Bariatricus massiliensis]MCB7389289.1 magnesium transporter [Bariatricus massiliensis]MCB7413431.1 magnesium transporter [Bariatricus massiliensis]MCQ5252054.1 magnesium transporter [Bariatricus massiliensis]